MKSTFKSFSRESRKTYLEREQILTILGNAPKNQWVSMKDMVTCANILGWTTPFEDNKRKATTHPYSKILSLMTDKEQPTYYVKNLVRRQVANNNAPKYEYKLMSK